MVYCSLCGRPIYGQVVALDEHPICDVCWRCWDWFYDQTVEERGSQ